MKILVVDDDAAIRQSIRRTLTRFYHADVTEAANGFDALERLMRTPFDLVLLDVNMPAMDGIKTLQVIRRSPHRNAVPVVMLTGSADQTKVQQAHRLGVAGYLLKPIQPDALVRRLNELLALAQSPETAPIPAAPRELLTLHKQDHVLLVERDVAYLDFAWRQLSTYCRVDLAISSVRALQACVEAPPTAIFLGCPEDFAANALFVAKVRNHPRLSAVPVYALVAPDRLTLAEAQVGFDAVLPRTLDEEIWKVAAPLVIRPAPEPAAHLERAMDAAREYLASRVTGEVATIAGLSTRWLQRWLSIRFDFSTPDGVWSLTCIASDTSGIRIARAEPAAGAGPFTEASAITSLTALALEAFEAIQRDRPAGLPATPHCEIQTCTGPPSAEDGVISAEKWVLALQSEILLLIRLSERPVRSRQANDVMSTAV